MLKKIVKNGVIIIKEGTEYLLDSIAPGEFCAISFDCGIAYDTIIFRNKGTAVYSVLSDAYSFIEKNDDFVSAICELEKNIKEKYENIDYLDIKDNLEKIDSYQYRKK